LHHGQCDRKRVHRGHRGRAPGGAGGDRAVAVWGHAAAEHHRASLGVAGRPRRRQGSHLMTSAPITVSSPLQVGGSVYKTRKLKDLLVRATCVVFTLLALVPLLSVLYYLTVRGIGGVNPAFFTQPSN